MLLQTDTVILCGGEGKRLRPVLSDAPKVLAQVNGRPFLDILVKHLKGQGLRRIILCTGYKADAIERYYRQNNQGMVFEFVREIEPLGTGGALKNARCFIQSDPFFLLNGDSFCPVDMNAFLEFHHSNSARASMVVSSRREPIGRVPAGETSAFGRVTLDDEARIVGFQEKESQEGECYVNAGVYCLSEDIWALMPGQKRFSLEYDFFPALLVDKRFYGFRVDQPFYDIGTPERYDQAKQALKRT